MNELVFRPATELAQVIRSREVSACEVLEAHLEQIARHNPQINAVVTLDEEGARRRAAEADAALARGEPWGPLHGVPMTLKDTYETAGMRTTLSHKPLRNYVPQQDATVVARLRAAGAIIIGKTNMPELGMDIQTNSPLFGRANNPWNLERTTGGSSGGAAAALATGMTPLEVGTDLGGSIRIPTHFCGTFALKATHGLIPYTGAVAGMHSNYHRMVTVGLGPMARTVEDLRLVLRLIAGPDERDPDIPPVPPGDPAIRPLRDLRLAWTDNFGGVPVTEDTRAALHRLADDLAAQGCRVDYAAPSGWDFDEIWLTWGELAAFIAAPEINLVIRLLGRMVSETIFRGEKLMGAAGRALDAGPGRYYEALRRRDRIIEALERFLADYDAWLCPVATVPAFPHHRPGLQFLHPQSEPIDVDGRLLPYYQAALSYVAPFNVTGSPVVVLPLARPSEGLPIGVQVVGRRWRDMDLLNVATALSGVTGPFRPPPGY